jgi:hypothetical protein
MPDTPVTADFNQTFDVKCNLAAQVSLDIVILVDKFAQTTQLIFSKIFDPGIGANPGVRQDRYGPISTNTINIAQRNFNPFVTR